MDSSSKSHDRLVYTPPNDGDSSSQEYLIFLIGGNPGYISYYEPFLSCLYAQLLKSSLSESARFYIFANSLAGFDNNKLANGTNAPGPIGLEAQIENTEDLIYDQIKRHRTADPWGDTFPKVILIGHSVGAYILLEIIRRHKKRIEEKPEEDFDLIGGILLFPTIVNIARSPMGLVASQYLKIPRIAQITGAVVQFWANLFPESLLYQLVRLVMRFPEHAASTTVRMLKSATGVRQALFLAKDEMEMITEDRWNEEVWGAAIAAGTNRQDTANQNLVFYWGRSDQWVAKHTREDLIAARGHRAPKGAGALSDDWKPTMFVDEDRIPHGFCIKHSDIMADMVSKWLKQVIRVHQEESSMAI